MGGVGTWLILCLRRPQLWVLVLVSACVCHLQASLEALKLPLGAPSRWQRTPPNVCCWTEHDWSCAVSPVPHLLQHGSALPSTPRGQGGSPQVAALPPQVERVLHPLLRQQYELHRERLVQRCERRPAEHVLYHGTTATAVSDICAYGFNRSFCGRNGETGTRRSGVGGLGRHWRA